MPPAILGPQAPGPGARSAGCTPGSTQRQSVRCLADRRGVHTSPSGSAGVSGQVACVEVTLTSRLSAAAANCEWSMGCQDSLDWACPEDVPAQDGEAGDEPVLAVLLCLNLFTVLIFHE